MGAKMEMVKGMEMGVGTVMEMAIAMVTVMMQKPYNCVRPHCLPDAELGDMDALYSCLPCII